MPPIPELLAANHPVLTALLHAAAAAYALGFAVTLARPRFGRAVILAGLVAHLAATVGRGWAEGFFPLTNKMESFSTAALAMAIVAVLAWYPTRLYLVPMLAALLAAMAAALSFPLNLAWPPPLMRTIWYPLHVPIAFVAYALWAAGAASSLAWLRSREPMWLVRIDRFALQGFALWSLSMICGGVWGVVAWGAYFLWDPKVVWSVILWFHYATFVHLRLTPSLQGRAWVRPALAVAGFAFVLVAYVGTSFLFKGSTHAF